MSDQRVFSVMLIFLMGVVYSYVASKNRDNLGTYLIFSDFHYDPFYGSTEAMNHGNLL